MPCAGWGEPASSRPFRLLPSRSILPALLSGEQLVSRHAGRPLPVRVPLCLAALLAVCVSRGPRPGEPLPSALPEGVRDPILLVHPLVTALTGNFSLRLCLQPLSAGECML